MKGFIIYPSYKIIDSKAYVLLYGRLENNQSFLTVNEFKPYFYIKERDIKKARKKTKLPLFEQTNLKNFDGEGVIKVIFDLPKEVPATREDFKDAGIEVYEADVRYEYRFLIDNNLKGAIEISGEYELSNDMVDRLYKNPEVKPADYVPTNLKMLSLDIETSSDQDTIYCIGLFSKNYKKSIIISKKKFPNTISCKGEEELLERFQDELLKFDPDIITGWNVIDFDLSTIKEKFKKYNIPFMLGRDNRQCTIRIETEFFRTSKANFPGRLVLDGLDLTRSSFVRLENYKLNTAAKTLLGKTKLIESLGKEKYDEIDELYKKNQKKLLEYNIVDSQLVHEILEKGKILDLTVQRTLLTGMPLDRVNASIASLDFLYIQKANEKGIVCPTGTFKEKTRPITGGYVKESTPGIYDNLLVLDFKSLYPSIIRTFNIDPYSFQEKKGKGSIETVNKAYFKNQEGILPEILEGLWKQREIVRKNKNELARYAIKILMNSFFGVLANPSCRFFNPKIANAITESGQELIKQTAKKVEEKGYQVIYSDTDSVFIDSKLDSEEEATKLGKKLEKEINAFYKNHISEEYKRASSLELEFEKIYTRFLMPKVRSGNAGAKKRYAGFLNGKVDIVGMEFARSDWTEAARVFQKELIKRIFEKKEVTKFIKKFVKDIIDGRYDQELVYRKSIRKDLKGYTKITPPHVKAARKLDNMDSSIIEYYITKKGPEPIQKQKNPIDYDHYIEKQIKPIAEGILDFFDIKFADILKGSKQTTLFGYS